MYSLWICTTRSIFQINKCLLRRFNSLKFKYNVTKLKSCKIQSRFLSSPMDSSSENGLSDGNIFDDSDIDSRLDDDFRNILFANSSDPIINDLKLCSSVQDVFDIIERSFDHFNAHHCSQAILVLWDLQKSYMDVNNMLAEESFKNPYQDTEKLLNDYKRQVTTHETFQKLLSKIDETHASLNVNLLTYILLHLTKIGIPIHDELIQKIVKKIIQHAEKVQYNLTLPEISRFLVSVFQEIGFYPLLTSLKFMPVVLKALDACNRVDDLHVITISLRCLHQLVTNNVLETYKTKAETLLNNGTINTTHIRTIMKVIQFLTYPVWALENSALIRKYLLLLKGNIHVLQRRELVTLNKSIVSNLEPREILSELQDVAFKKFFSETVDPATFHSPDILSCLVPFNTQPYKKQRTFENIAKNYINSGVRASTIPSLFNILRYLKTSDYKLCFEFWQQTLEYLRNNPDERLDYRLFRIAHYYMYFNNNLGATFRHFEFESQMIVWLINQLNDNICKYIPSKYSRAMSFIIAYGFSTKNRSAAIEYLTKSKFEFNKISPQFDHIDCIIY